jgi:hypothetical protein
MERPIDWITWAISYERVEMEAEYQLRLQGAADRKAANLGT